jgi:5-methylthioribose kinase
VSDELSHFTELVRSQGWLTADDSLVKLTTAGDGNMNWVRRATARSGTTLILKRSLPYVAKYPDIPAPQARIEVEAAFYRAIEHTRLADDTPSVIGFDNTTQTLCLEDLGEGKDLTRIYSGDTDEAPAVMAKLLSWLSELHALPIPNPLLFNNLDMRKLNHEHIFALPFTCDNGLELTPALADAWRTLLDPALSDQAKALGDIYLRTYTDNASLLHGDFYPGSWLRQTSGAVAVIDPEFCFYGPAAFDLGVFWAHLRFANYSDEESTAMLTHYGPYNEEAARKFAGVEILRRLFGVAQLPLTLSDEEKITLAHSAKEMVLT